MDVPQGPPFEPSYVYDVLRLKKYASSFMVSTLKVPHVPLPYVVIVGVSGVLLTMRSSCVSAGTSGGCRGVSGLCAQRHARRDDGFPQPGDATRNRCVSTGTCNVMNRQQAVRL